jgi:tRNA threonylcarbamoyladenosine biosynthesis protein TsaB
VLTLAFDTATRWGRFALAADGEVLVDRPHNVSGSYADALLPVIAEVCRDGGKELADVAAVAVTQGPGSFTGVRIAVATAKGLAYALGARLCAAPTTAAMAAALLDAHAEADLAVPALDARRGELYAGIYRRAAGWVEPVVAPAAQAPGTWWRTVQETVPDVEAPVYGGDGVPLLVGREGRLRPELQARGRPVRRLWSAAHPATAAALARAVSASVTGVVTVHPFALVPLYLRGSDAEVKRHLDVTPRTPSPGVDVHRSGGPDRSGRGEEA